MTHFPQPVFYDPTKKRQRRFKQVLLVIGSLSTILLVVFIVSIIIIPEFKPLTLATIVKPRPHHKIQRESLLSFSKREIIKASEDKRVAEQKTYILEQQQRGSNKPPLSPLVVGFLVNWDYSSFDSLKKNFSKIDIIVPEWIHLKDASGNITLDDIDIQTEVTTYARNRYANVPIIPLINNAGWQTKDLSALLHQPSARTHLISELLTYIQNKKYSGISIDFENIPNADQENYTALIEELGHTFHAHSLKVSINIPPDNTSFLFRRLSTAVDYITLMMYDEHIATDSPGPISGIDWYAGLLAERAKDIPSEKMIVAMGNYSNDWPDKNKADQKTFEDALLTASDSEGVITLDPLSLSPTYTYTDESETDHTVWMQDAVSVFNQYHIAGRFAPAGVALWRLGGEDTSIWNFLGNSFDTTYTTQSVQNILGSVSYNYNLDYENDGEILKVTALPHGGERTVDFTPSTGLVSGENFTKYPAPYVIGQYGTSATKIALTFDDGPDSTFTPFILDILKQKHVEATFFLVGENVEKYPGLASREYVEGHELGNHTFSHPNISAISPTQLRLELSTTERLIESSVGHQTILFRAPFADDSEPNTPDQMAPVAEVTSRGYLMVGMHIDPSDWQSPPADQIVERVLGQIQAGNGNVILLHDGGGERGQTVIALPKIIDALRTRGYTFVLISDLIGKSRDDIMPLVPRVSRIESVSNSAAFSIARFIGMIIQTFFYLGLFLGIVRFFAIGILATIEFFRERKKMFDPNFIPSIAVIISAYNEEKVINQTISTLLDSTYPKFEIIVVNDGSKDDTLSVVKREYGSNPRVQIYTQENTGKAIALNFGITKTNADVIISLDADTIFTPDTLSLLARHFVDPQIGAVAGNAKVGNRNNLLTKFQALEYIVSQNLDRRAFSVLDAITVVPGAVGAWRRKALLKAGGFSFDTLAEDSDLTICIRKLGYSITYEDHAMGITEAPETVKNLIKQRFRWMYGTLQVAWKHINVLFNPRYGSLGMIAMPNIIIFQVIFPIISPIMDLTVVISIFITLFTYRQHPENFSSGSLLHILYFYLLFLVIEILAASIAFLFEKNEDPKLLVWIIIQRFYYRQLMYYIALKSLFTSLRGIAVGWNKFDRTASVKVEKK